jgi:hypothetical protein
MTGIVGVLLSLAAGASVWAGAQATGETQIRTVCALEGKGDFGLGWTERTDGAAYRCLPTFDASLKPSGVAWIKVETDGTVARPLLR